MRCFDMRALSGVMFERQLSTVQLGAQAGIKYERCREIMAGRVKPTPTELFNICHALGVEEGDFSFEIQTESA